MRKKGTSRNWKESEKEHKQRKKVKEGHKHTQLRPETKQRNSGSDMCGMNDYEDDDP